MERTTLGERHVVVEIVRSKDIRLTCLGVVFVDTRFPDNPDVVGVVFYQTLHDTLVQVDVLKVVHGDVVLQERLARNFCQAATHRGNIRLAIGAYQGIVDIVCHQRSLVSRKVI